MTRLPVLLLGNKPGKADSGPSYQPAMINVHDGIDSCKILANSYGDLRAAHRATWMSVKQPRRYAISSPVQALVSQAYRSLVDDVYQTRRCKVF